ncbi:TlyA family RNA methyltransferase [Acidipila sp. EB88]|uniref:TlyA family RNA methyltransferase n=1 Tax=Acidipila sp. EB88 TaxID=2305226 RepID=UPI000F5EDF33|nr:TlyA family RNA methyltransferase [Acidipila sp. EB88]RRA49435.1 TlyA family RNA methyltransferase [Acidipila sp. EB88]
MKTRLDKLLVERGLVPTRERAQALLLAGRVLVDEQKQTKPGLSVDPGVALRLLGDDLRYVSRGGLKLERALEHWGIDLCGRDCLDVGASTGGFSDCMLQHGAASVLAVDTGWGQIAQKLRSDVRVTLMERCNARKLVPDELAKAVSERTLSFVSMDVSFISATLVLPPVLLAAPTVREAVVLVKPQFEAGREWVGKGGIVRDPEAHVLAQEKVRLCVVAAGANSVELIESPITGTEGNHEFLLHALWR